MNRKNFLASVIAAGAAMPALGSRENLKQAAIIPPYLKPGDLVGITSPAGYITHAEIQPAIQQLQHWGYQVKIGDTIGKREFTRGGTDEERAADFQQMIDDPMIRAIMCGRGGYGFIRIIDRLDFTRLIKNPKWIIGFSDITVLHCHLDHHYGIASLHSKMCNSFPEDWLKAEPVQVDTILSIRDALAGIIRMQYHCLTDTNNRTGTGQGKLIGGNLKTIESLAGTRSSLQTTGKILFVEDTGEYLYCIDRMFWHLKRTGQLHGLQGLIIGGFKVKPDDPGEEFGKTLQQIVLEKVAEYRYPVCFNFPVGHQKNNFALKCGVVHRLSVDSAGASLLEI